VLERRFVLLQVAGGRQLVVCREVENPRLDPVEIGRQAIGGSFDGRLEGGIVRQIQVFVVFQDPATKLKPSWGSISRACCLTALVKACWTVARCSSSSMSSRMALCRSKDWKALSGVEHTLRHP
jgi:hypothetical protein